MSILQALAAFFMTLAPGIVGSYYGAMSGYYIRVFHQKTFYIHMLLCYCATQPLVSLVQRHFDSYFDERLSTPVTYSFRVIGMQVVLGASVVFWMYAPEAQPFVLALGVWIGIISAVIVSSSFQMVAAMEPGFMIYARLGMHFAGLVAPIVVTLLGFQPDSPHSEFQKVLLTAVVTSALAACILAYLHLTTDVFRKAYSRLSYDLEPAEQELQDTGLGLARQVTETSPLGSSDGKTGVPNWVYRWLAGNALSMGVEFYVASLVGFFGSPALAQHLSLIRMCMNLLGRLLSIPVPYSSCFKEGPWHTVMSAAVFLIVVLGGFCLSKAFRPYLSEAVFMTAWYIVPTIRSFAGSLVDVTVASYVEVRERKSLARLNELGCFSGVLIGLTVGQVTGHVLQQWQP
jgi:hypothetical protein